MTIDFVQRLNRLVRADAHGLLESLEDRSLLLKQHLREAELELQRKRARLATLADEERRLAEDAARLEGATRALDEDTRLALGQGREDLARFAIRRLLPRRAEIDALRARAADLAEERGRVEALLEQQESEFEELRSRIRSRLAEVRAAEEGDLELEPAVSDEEIELELLRRQQAAGGAQ